MLLPPRSQPVRICTLALFHFVLAVSAMADEPDTTSGNPVFPGWYADPEAVVYGNTYWIYPTTSARFPKQLYFDCFSSPDLVHWTKHPRILDSDRVKWARQAMWAPSAIEKDGKYYFFFAANDIQSNEEPGGIGVAVADSPAGPFQDYLRKPLIDKIHNGAQPIDQYVFKDEGQYYIVYGGWGRCNIARINDKFTGLVPFPDGETYKEITPDGYKEGPIMFRRNGKLYFMWSEGGWTGPNYCVAYAIAESPLGPFRRIGKVLQQDPQIATGAGHHSVINVPNTDQWYIVYHRRPLGETDRDHRVTCIDRMEFREDGTIKPVTITFEGVAPQPIASSTIPCVEGLRVTCLGKLSPGLPADDDHRGTDRKWEKVQALLGERADNVIVKQPGCDLGGNTSVRNSSPLVWKESGYFRRARDLGQVFTAPRDFSLDSIVLRTGNSHLCFLPGANGAEVFVQFFKVEGDPVIDDNGTPPGVDATHGFSKNHRCDDFVSGVEYKPLCIVTGGQLPDLMTNGDGKLTYMKWSFLAEQPLAFKAGEQYAFMVGFAKPGPERNFTLGNRNNASSPAPPAIEDGSDTYGGGWGLRREGNGVTPPQMMPGQQPPADVEQLNQLQCESSFPTGGARYAISPTCDGYPDVDTYRDLEFYIIAK